MKDFCFVFLMLYLKQIKSKFKKKASLSQEDKGNNKDIVNTK